MFTRILREEWQSVSSRRRRRHDDHLPPSGHQGAHQVGHEYVVGRAGVLPPGLGESRQVDGHHVEAGRGQGLHGGHGADPRLGGVDGAVEKEQGLVLAGG